MSGRKVSNMGKFMNFLKQKSTAQAEDYYKDRTKKNLMGRVDNYLGRTPDPTPIPGPSHMQAIIDRAESELDMEERALAHGGETWRAEQIELNKKAELAVQKIKQQKEARPYGNGNQEWLKAYQNEELIVGWVDLFKAERLWTQTSPLRWPCLAESGFLRTGIRTEPSKLAHNSTLVLDGRQDFRPNYVRRLIQNALPFNSSANMHQHTASGHNDQFAVHTGSVVPFQQPQRHSFHDGPANFPGYLDTKAAYVNPPVPVSQRQEYQPPQRHSFHNNLAPPAQPAKGAAQINHPMSMSQQQEYQQHPVSLQ